MLHKFALHLPIICIHLHKFATNLHGVCIIFLKTIALLKTTSVRKFSVFYGMFEHCSDLLQERKLTKKSKFSS